MKIKQYDFEKIAQRIKAVRKDRNITQAHVAKKCNVSRSTVIKWEKGESFPELNSMLKLCNLYDCELGYLLCESGYENGKRETTEKKINTYDIHMTNSEVISVRSDEDYHEFIDTLFGTDVWVQIVEGKLKVAICTGHILYVSNRNFEDETVAKLRGLVLEKI